MADIKKLFEQGQGNKLLTNSSVASVGDSIESADFVKSRVKQIKQFTPAVDFTTASNFAYYGLAEEYYKNSFDYITNEYPYDGSKKEKIDWELSGTYLDKHIFDKVYPRTNGFVNIGYDYGTTSGGTTGDFQPTTTQEYIKFYGGPNKADGYDSTRKISEYFSGSNVYSTGSRQDRNIDIDGTQGFSIEFWLKKPDFSVGSQSSQQVILDIWNNSSDAASKGSVLVYLYDADDGKIFVDIKSGSVDSGYEFDASVGSIDDNEWRHYALTFKNDGANLASKYFVNGVSKGAGTVLGGGGSIGAITGSMVGYIGALSANPDLAGEGRGKLSGSLDDFRLWKTERTEKDIKQNWFTNVNGGSNSDYELAVSSSKKFDLSNPVDLGVYFKFNEGIIDTSSINSQDAIVLDYAGRSSNGTWTGYAVGSRETGSAMVLSNAASSEFRDPIIYSDHPTVSSLRTDYVNQGKLYDRENNSALYWSLPSWITTEDQSKSNSPLRNLTQIMASQFDKLQLQMSAMRDIKDRSYKNVVSGANPPPFMSQILRSFGLDNDEILSNATQLEYLASRNETENFEEKLNDTKNLIYLNIYNNLVDIYKSKGTEKAFRNLIRCFGVDESIVNLNLYGSNVDYELRENERYSVVRKKAINFFDPTRFEALVYQERPAPSSDQSEVINFTDLPVNAGTTFECQAFFKPNPPKNIDGSFAVDFLTSSIFGAHTTNVSVPTWLSPDLGNFQVYSIRKNLRSNEAYFSLTGTAGGFMPPLTSSVFKDVYNDSKWNLSLRVYPEDPFVGSVTGSVSTNYIVRFTGFQYVLDDMVNSFDVSSSISDSSGISFIQADKRMFIGAHRTNFTSAVLEKTNAQISSCRVWAKKIENDKLKIHAKNPFNFGVESPGDNHFIAVSGTELGLSPYDLPDIKTLAMNWDFETVTGTDSSGRFVVPDFSSGSANASGYSFLDNLTQIQHPGYAQGFPAISTTDVVTRKFINSSIQKKPEVINSSNMVSIVSETDDELFTRTSRPIDYYFSFEKSMYNVISQDMLNMFATIVDFNNIIGEPVYRYRPEYKGLEKLRQLYFQNVDKDPDFERFLEYYKWIDASISTMLMQLAPASANFLDGMKNMIESHVLERNKYWSKFPTLDTNKPTDVEATVLGRMQQNKSVSITEPGEEPCPFEGTRVTITNDKGITVTYCEYTEEQEQRARIDGEMLFSPAWYDGGSNTPNKDKRVDYFKDQLKQGSSVQLNTSVSEISKQNFNNVRNTFLEKDKLNFAVDDTSIQGGYGVQSGDKVAPFSLYSSSVESGYITEVRENFNPQGADFTSGVTSSVEITNYHDDSYGESGVPMQGPFSQEHVGGKQYRHQGVVSTVQTDGDLRAEGWNLDISSNNIQVTPRSFSQAKATMLRDGLAKRPVNVKNIKYNSGSSILGNYSNDYEVFQTTGRTTNSRYYIKVEGATPTNASSSYVKDLFDYELPRFNLTGTNKSIFVERFSAPGGPETTAGGTNVYGGEFSVYNSLNYRNLAVRTALNEWYTEHAGQFGIKSGSSVRSEDYNTNAAYHKTNRNARHVIREGNDCAVIYDNWWLQHAIPQSAFQYSWITASVSKSVCDTFGYVTPFTIPSGTTSVTQSAVPFISQSSVNASDIYVDFIGLNTLINDPINPDSNTLSSSTNTYKNTDIASISDGDVPNSLFLHRNGPYGVSSWSQIRAGQTPIPRYHKKNNTLSVSPAPSVITLLNGSGSGKVAQYLNKRPDEFRNFIEPPVSFKNKPLVSTVVDTEGNQTKLVHTYANKKEYFSQPIGTTGSISDYISFQEPNTREVYDEVSSAPNLNLLENHYGEIIYPRDARTGLAQTRTRVNYAETATITNGSASFSTGSNGIDRGPLLRRSIWRDNESLRNRRIFFEGTQYTPINLFSAPTALTSAIIPNVATTLPNSQGFLDGAATSVYGLGRTPITFCETTWFNSSFGKAYYSPQSLFPPDSNTTQFLSSSSTIISLFPDTGELNSANWQTIAGYIGISSGSSTEGSWAYQTTFHPTASAYYYHRSVTLGNTQTASLNKLAWRTSELSNKEPWYDSYDNYTQDISKLAQNFTIIPEFKISDHMNYYSEFNFRKNNDKFLILNGANITSSADTEEQDNRERLFNESFFNEYSNTDFQEYFGKFSSDLNLERITLTCNGVKKLLPYNGFYPSHRSLQVASLFSQSVGPHISGLGWENGSSISSEYENSGALSVQAMLQPWYAPGILYNTIKSGVAVDWAAYTSSFSAQIPGAASTFGIALSNESNYRIPFESILDPLSNIGIPTRTADQEGIKMDLLYPTYTGVNQYANSVFNTAHRAFQSPRIPFVYVNEDARTKALSSDKYNLYRLGINNFLAETARFFLDEEKLKSITSKRQEEISFVSGTAYYMDITLEKDNNVVMIDDYLNKVNNGHPTSITQYRTYNGQFFGPPVTGGIGEAELFNASCSVYYDTMPEYGQRMFEENAGDPLYAQYTPPYFYGKAKATIKYVADEEDEKGNFSYKKLFEKASVVYENKELHDKFTKIQKRAVFVPWSVSGSGTAVFECSSSTTAEYFSLRKTSASSAWDVGASSSIDLPVTGGQFLEWQILQENKDVFVGLNDNPSASASYPDVNFAIQASSDAVTGGSRVYVWENGSSVLTSSVVYNTDNWFRIDVDDAGTVKYQISRQTTQADTSYPNGNPRVGDRDTINGAQTMFKFGDPNLWETFYVSTTKLTSSLYPDVTLFNQGASLAYAQVSVKDRVEYPAEKGAMQISSSLNLFGVLTEKQSRFNENGDLLEVVDDPSENRNRWIISPKMETPVLDFSNQPRVEQFGRGMWSGYGQILTSSNGVTFGIEETFKDGLRAGSGSLVEKCFDTPQLRKIGEIADLKKISEAIVAIPYSPNPHGKGSKYAETTSVLDRNFFRIKTRTFDFYKKWYEANKNGNLSSIPVDEEGNKKPSESITKMMSIAGDYVLPPEIDFMTYDSGRTRVNPFAMYIFEFNHYLDAQDLADIWQGVMPKISTNPEFSDPSVDNNIFSHATGKDEFFHGKQLPPDTRWMVFKIKKRAGYNYFEVTPTNSDDEQFNLAFSLGKDKKLKYSFNWPYDFFSLVELAQVETENTFVSSDDQIEEEDN